MNEAKLYTLETFREFLTWAKDSYTRKITETSGGCETCGYGGYENTVGYETDFDTLFANLEVEMDEFEETFCDRN